MIKKKQYKTILNCLIVFKGFSLMWVLLLIGSWFSCNLKTEIKTPEATEREQVLKHKIKSTNVYRTDFRNGVAQNEFLLQVRIYDSEGLRTKEINYNDSIKIHSIINYEYDKNHNLLLSTSKGPDSSLIFREIRKYNEKDKMTELIFYLPDGTYKYRNISTYDNIGNLKQLAYYWPEGLKSINKYTYIGKFKIEDAEYDSHGKFNYKWTFTYDKFGNEIEAIQYYPHGVTNAIIKSQFNSDNQLISKATFIRNSFQSKFVFKYDNKNLLSQKIAFSTMSIISAIYRYQYNFKKF